MLALLSVSDKEGLLPFARGLVAAGFELLSTGGTHAALVADGLPVKKVSEHTGAKEILGGRVKTLHPKIHGGILARALPGDRQELADAGIVEIDLVAVNLYPFREAVEKGAAEPELVEQIDIGGPAMIRASAKNFERVTVVVDPSDYPRVLAELSEKKAVSLETRRALMAKAFRHTAAYDAAIAAKFAQTPFPERRSETFVLGQPLRYGENPHQAAALYRDERRPKGPAVPFCRVLQGKELSYNNLLDLDSALRLLLEFNDRAAAVIVKHNIPCGVAEAPDLEAAYRAARSVDEVSAFGGIVALNRPLEVGTAKALVETFLEAVIAPDVHPSALEVLAQKKGLRVLSADVPFREPPPPAVELRSVLGGMLMQDRDAKEPSGEWRVVSKRAPTADELAGMRFAWRICKHVKSNAIVFAGPERLLAVGGGQTSRVDAVKIAASRGGERLKGSAVASDAFFPFRDGVDEIARTGASCIVQPGGSVRDNEVIEAADAAGLAMVFTGVRHFRH